MDNLPEVVGSMPSVPVQKPVQTKPRSSNFGASAGFFLWSGCALAFPEYTHIDDLSTGVFYGISFVLLFIAIAGLWDNFKRRNNHPSKATVTKATSTKPRKRRGLYITRIFLVLILCGIFLLTFPTQAGFLSVAIFLVLLIGIIVFYRVISQRGKSHKPLESVGTGSGSTTSPRKSKSNGLEIGLAYLFIGLYFLAIPKIMNENGLAAGIFYGMGLTILSIAIMGLCNVVSRPTGKNASPGQTKSV